jgi:hypothetical protein
VVAGYHANPRDGEGGPSGAPRFPSAVALPCGCEARTVRQRPWSGEASFCAAHAALMLDPRAARAHFLEGHAALEAERGDGGERESEAP